MKYQIRQAQLISAVILSLTSFAVHSEGLLDKLKDALPLPGKTQAKSSPDAERRAADRESLNPESDRLCDSLTRSYALNENILELGVSQLKCKLTQCNSDEVPPKDPAHLEQWLRNYSTKRVWLPVPIESTVGATFLSDQQKQGAVLERGEPRNDKYYAKLDEALKAVKTSYPAVPYEIKIVVVDITNRVNAQAAPGGYIFVTKAAAKDLDEGALQLVVGHEVAHLAKRHTSKQLQARLMESEQGVELFKRMMSMRLELNQRNDMARKIVDRLKCSFAKYQQEQETQADACSARTMIEAGGDPLSAWSEYIRVRGSETDAEEKSPPSDRTTCFASLATHPEDREREANFRGAVGHHRSRGR